MTPKQMPLEKLSEDKRADLERQLYESIGHLEDRKSQEAERRHDWNEGTKKMQADISNIARKLREDDALPDPKDDDDRKTAEEIAERMVTDEGENQSSDA